MNFKKNITDGVITNTADGSGWISAVDATGGGFNPQESYTYAKFTDKGLEKVDLADDKSLDSIDWDIAFRRFIIRVNSGSSGPSCTKAATIGKIADYDTITSVPPNTTFKDDVYFDDKCALIKENSGLGSPATALSSFWEYPVGCVKMTGDLFMLQLSDGRHVKISVLNFYTPDVQTQCDTTGSVPMTGSGSGNVRVRWAVVP